MKTYSQQKKCYNLFGARPHAVERQFTYFMDLAYLLTTRNPNKCTHYLRAISTIVEIISIIKRVTSHFSSELSSGRRPESKSDEKCEVTLLIIEIWRCEFSMFPIHRYTYWDFESCPPIDWRWKIRCNIVGCRVKSVSRFRTFSFSCRTFGNFTPGLSEKARERSASAKHSNDYPFPLSTSGRRKAYAPVSTGLCPAMRKDHSAPRGKARGGKKGSTISKTA